ncbi:serine/threonine protein kinase [Pauljensenia hongkongensis]|nr:serine/threonine protein kinase [Pauljensenia hongkongensis]
MLKPMSLPHYVPAVLAFACAFVLADVSLASAVTSAPTAPAALAAPSAPTGDSAQSTPPGRSPMTMVCTSEREGIPGSAARPGDPSVASAHCQYVPAPTPTGGSAGQ